MIFSAPYWISRTRRNSIFLVCEASQCNTPIRPSSDRVSMTLYDPLMTGCLHLKMILLKCHCILCLNLQNYDPEKAQEQMIKTGLFNAINAKGVVNKEVFD